MLSTFSSVSLIAPPSSFSPSFRSLSNFSAALPLIRASATLEVGCSASSSRTLAVIAAIICSAYCCGVTFKRFVPSGAISTNFLAANAAALISCSASISGSPSKALISRIVTSLKESNIGKPLSAFMSRSLTPPVAQSRTSSVCLSGIPVIISSSGMSFIGRRFDTICGFAPSLPALRVTSINWIAAPKGLWGFAISAATARSTRSPIGTYSTAIDSVRTQRGFPDAISACRASVTAAASDFSFSRVTVMAGAISSRAARIPTADPAIELRKLIMAFADSGV